MCRCSVTHRDPDPARDRRRLQTAWCEGARSPRQGAVRHPVDNGCVAALVGAQVRSGHPMPTSMSRSQSGAHIERLWGSSWASHAVEIVVVDGMVLTVDGAHARNEKAAIPPRLGGSAIRSKAWTDGSNGTCCILYGHEDLLAWKTCGTDHVQKVKSAQLRAISRSQISLGKQNLTNGQNQAKISYIYQIGTSRISTEIKSWR